MAKAAAKAPRFVRDSKDGVYLNLRVSPSAKTTAIKGLYTEDRVKLSVATPPVEGKANLETERHPAGLFGVPRSGVTVVRGASGRDKLVFVRGADTGAARASLAGLVG